MKTAELNVDVAVIGAGLSGMAAAAFAARRRLKVAMIGWTRGEMPFASGLLDVLEFHPVSAKNQWENPWEGIRKLIDESPEHPYARLGLETIRSAMSEFCGIMADGGISYRSWPESNAVLPTAAGTTRVTYSVPETMWPGVTGMKEKRRALIVDFEGMKDFSAIQAAEALRDIWPGLRARRVVFPHAFPGADRHNLLLAQALESAEVRTALGESLRAITADFDMVGFPAVLGINRSLDVASELGRIIGRPVFEIPTLPPSVPGHRLMNAMDSVLERSGVLSLTGKRVIKVESEESRCTGVVIRDGGNPELVLARSVILATGRFLGGGLAADRGGIRETVLGLPAYQPEKREEWHRDSFFDLRGHPVNRSGLLTDRCFRPLDETGCRAFDNLFVAGSVLAHQDWVREKSGAGIAVSTAYGAVQGCIRCCR